ncbi:hypothetical protein M9H77_30639 [Catharanthus roseus]|uniref:Uncharacterized protein n=1 Tax=Catharanthus roseus TaxID=4058 RepID=A0ACB9ZZ47_CATRO|nr:hypothetical protein M9H77_30639 [Catharanthus roseus]
MRNNQWRYGRFSSHARSYDIILMIAMRAIDLELEMFIMIHLVKVFQEMMLEMEEIIRRSPQTLGTISRPVSYNNLKLPLLCGSFGPYEYEALEQKVKSLFDSHCVREKEKFNWYENLLLMRSMSCGIVNVKIEEGWELNQSRFGA